MPKVVNIRVEKCEVYIGRGSKWGNPFSHIPNSNAPFQVDSREDAIRAYADWILNQPELLKAAKIELRNKDLGCYCAPMECHGDILLKIANSD
jgi:hypothetical protein